MKTKGKKISYDNRGSAIIIALVVTAVLMVLSLSLLAVSYSFFLAQKKNNGDAYEREMFYSAIEVFEQELFEGGHKTWAEGINNKTKEANPDDNLFGSKIVASIFKYHENPGIQETQSGEIPSVDRAWPCYDSDSTNTVESDKSKVSRCFKITSISAYEITAQMYWEYENNDRFIDDIALHAIYRLKKDNKTLMKNERVYRLGSSMGAARLVEEDDESSNENGNLEGEGTTEPKDYIINFGPRPKEQKYRVSPEFFPGMSVATDGEKLPFVRISKTEKEQDNFFEKEEYSYFNYFFNSWYTRSDNRGNPWNGRPQQLFDDYEPNSANKDRTARYQWNNAVPVRIRFVIKGFYLDIDIYKYCYLKYINNATGDQNFNKDFLRDNVLSNELLEACGITITDTDNCDQIIWKYEYKNNYYNFFDPNDTEGKPYIKPEHLNDTNKLEYTVYATFPSYYESGDYTKFKKGIIIPQYDKNKTISVDDICMYTKYSFERIIG